MQRPNPPPHWSWWQNVVAVLVLVWGLGMYTFEGMAETLFGKTVTFGYIPGVLVTVALYVIFNINVNRLGQLLDFLSRLAQKDKPDA